jgi:hypothetical protein
MSRMFPLTGVLLMNSPFLVSNPSKLADSDPIATNQMRSLSSTRHPVGPRPGTGWLVPERTGQGLAHEPPLAVRSHVGVARSGALPRHRPFLDVDGVEGDADVDRRSESC